MIYYVYKSKERGKNMNIFFITLIPRIFIKIFRIKHKHHFVYDGTFDGGLAGSVSQYACIWCGEKRFEW